MTGWLNFTIRYDGPAWKSGYPGVTARTAAQVEGEVKHSAEGSMAALLGELFRPDRQASWHFSIGKDGTVYQHYPIFGEGSITWHAGLPGDRSKDTALIGNLTLVGEEHEGGGPDNPGEPLTAAQLAASIRISQAVRELCPLGRPELRKNLWEHTWLSPTSCPSGRIPWARIIATLEEEEMALSDLDKQWISDQLNRHLKEIRGSLRGELIALVLGSYQTGLLGPAGNRDDPDFGQWVAKMEGKQLKDVITAIADVKAALPASGIVAATPDEIVDKLKERL